MTTPTSGQPACLTGAVGAGQVVRGLLFSVTVTDARTFSTVTVALGLASLVACYLPARRATRPDPTTALRTE